MLKRILIIGIFFGVLSLIIPGRARANLGEIKKSKIVICLLLPQTDSTGKTITVAKKAAQVLLNMGAYSGQCEQF